MKTRKIPDDPNYRISLCKMHATISSIRYKEKKFQDSLKEAKEFDLIKPAVTQTAGLSMRLPKIDLDPLKGKAKSAAEHALIADSLFEVHDLAEAEHEYREALKDDPDNIVYHSCLLKVLLDKKDFAAAVKEDAAVSNHVMVHIPDFFNQSKQKTPLAP